MVIQATAQNALMQVLLGQLLAAKPIWKVSYTTFGEFYLTCSSTQYPVIAFYQAKVESQAVATG
jgi:hypothetical protein